MSFRPVKTGKSAADFAVIIGSAGRTKAEKAVGVAVCGTANLLSGQLERPLFQKPPDIRFASAFTTCQCRLTADKRADCGCKCRRPGTMRIVHEHFAPAVWTPVPV